MRKSWIPSYIALGVIWGCSFIFIKLGLRFLTPVGVAFARCFFGSITLLIIAKIRRISLPTGKRTWFYLWIVSLLLNVIPGFLFAFAEVRVTSVLAGIMNATTPLMTLIVILLAFRTERPTRNQIIGLFVGGIGVLTVLGAWKGIGHNNLIGVIALLLATTCYGISFPFIRTRIAPLGLSSEALAATQVTTGALTLLPFFLIDGISRDTFTPGPIAAVLALGIFGSGIAYIWNFSIIKAAGSAVASTVTYLTPVVAVIVGWIFLGEHLLWNEPVGGLLVLLGAAISQDRFARA